MTKEDIVIADSLIKIIGDSHFISKSSLLEKNRQAMWGNRWRSVWQSLLFKVETLISLYKPYLKSGKVETIREVIWVTIVSYKIIICKYFYAAL